MTLLRITEELLHRLYTWWKPQNGNNQSNIKEESKTTHRPIYFIMIKGIKIY